MTLKEEYKKNLELQLEKMNNEIKKLEAKTEKAKANVKIQYYKEIVDLKEKQLKAENKLKELSEASDDAWEDLKVGIERSWHALSDAVKSAVKRFK